MRVRFLMMIARTSVGRSRRYTPSRSRRTFTPAFSQSPKNACMSIRR